MDFGDIIINAWLRIRAANQNFLVHLKLFMRRLNVYLLNDRTNSDADIIVVINRDNPCKVRPKVFTN
jgi:hypothetical protein